jgi:hypothetical protein
MANEQQGDWSKPFYGVSHKNGKSREWWATVTDRGHLAELTCWYPGCGFKPIQSTHDNAAAAKAAGERWLAAA